MSSDIHTADAKEHSEIPHTPVTSAAPDADAHPRLVATQYWLAGLYGRRKLGGEKRFLRIYAIYLVVVCAALRAFLAPLLTSLGADLMGTVLEFEPYSEILVAVICLGLWIALPSFPSRHASSDWHDAIEATNDDYRKALLHPEEIDPKRIDATRLEALQRDMATAAPLSADEARQLERYRQRDDVLPPCVEFPGDGHWHSFRVIPPCLPEIILLIIALCARIYSPTNQVGNLLFLGVSLGLLAFFAIVFFHRIRKWTSIAPLRGDQLTAQRMHEYFVRDLLARCRFEKQTTAGTVIRAPQNVAQMLENAEAAKPDVEPQPEPAAPIVDDSPLEMSDDDLKYCISLAQTGHEEAVARLKRAVKTGNKNAQFGLGTLYWRGIPSIGQDIVEAVRLLTLAAQNDHTEAMNSLGWIYHHGVGEVARNDALAIEFWEKAADHGDMTAQRKMALLYENGDGVEKDIHKAIEWYKKAGEQGDDKSLYNLGCIYFKGNGVPKDVELAREFFQKADDLGSELAHNMLKWMY